VRDLSIDFSAAGKVNHAVRHVSFNINKGETVALVGESGSGKTVSALSILRLLPYPAASHPTGEIYFHGRNILKLDESEMRELRGGRISIIFQEPMTSLNPLHTIEKQIGEVLTLHRGLSQTRARDRVVDVTASFGPAYTAGPATALAAAQAEGGVRPGARLLFVAAGPGIEVAAALYTVPATGQD